MEHSVPPYISAGEPSAPAARKILFISKATPGDDEFALWLAPRLEAEGYSVFADILKLEPGSRWRKEITATLQDKSAKLLLCCRDSTLAKDNVQEEVGIALDLAKQIPDSRFIIPLRLEAYKKVLGIGEIQYIDFTRGWAEGLVKLLAALKRQGIKPESANAHIILSSGIHSRSSRSSHSGGVKSYSPSRDIDPLAHTLSPQRVARPLNLSRTTHEFA